MTTEAHSLTLFIGPQSKHGLALALCLRDYRVKIAEAGLPVFPTRVASPTLRRAADPSVPVEARRDELDRLTAYGPAFFGALNFLGAPRMGLVRREMFPDAEALFAGLAEVLAPSKVRFVVAPEALPDFYLTTGDEGFEARVKGTGWEVLYELSWAELLSELRAAFPDAEILVLSPRGSAARSPEVLAELFGFAADAVPGDYFLNAALGETGRVVLDRMTPDQIAQESVRLELFDTMADRTDDETCRERLGMDRLTRLLLDQRFEEDMEELRRRDGVRVF